MNDLFCHMMTYKVILLNKNLTKELQIIYTLEELIIS